MPSLTESTAMGGSGRSDRGRVPGRRGARSTARLAGSRGGRRAEIPFDSDRKMMSVVRGHGWRDPPHVHQGRPEILLARCDGSRVGTDVRSTDAGPASRGAGRGRSLRAGVPGARVRVRRRTRRWPEMDESRAATSSIVGLCGMIDPPRDGSPRVDQAIAPASAHHDHRRSPGTAPQRSRGSRDRDRAPGS